MLKRLLKRLCSHRFSWPRIDANNRHYQVCLRCGAAYDYNWNAMRRTGRLLPDVKKQNDAAERAS